MYEMSIICDLPQRSALVAYSLALAFKKEVEESVMLVKTSMLGTM